MSVVTLGHEAPKVPLETIRTLASNAGIAVREDHLDDFAILLGALDQSVKYIMDEEDYLPKADLDKYPRSDISRPGPEDSDRGGWYV